MRTRGEKALKIVLLSALATKRFTPAKVRASIGRSKWCSGILGNAMDYRETMSREQSRLRINQGGTLTRRIS